jgi:hypothetical protein
VDFTAANQELKSIRFTRSSEAFNGYVLKLEAKEKSLVWADI